MRNLSLCAKTTSSLPNTRITAAAVDLDRDVLYVASEQHNPDNGEVAFEIWKIALSGSEDPSVLAIFTAAAPTTEEQPSSHILSYNVLAETSMLSVILRGGDITVISLGDEKPTIEVEGTVEHGISAASWSPDDSLLVLTTNEHKLILMTSTFDVLSEIPLHPAEFGEDAPINVGWGSKQTQFHGSLGKTAAQKPTISAIGSSPDDDTQPRISWRGDGAFFVVSSLSHPDSNGMRHRILRVYDRQAVLQSTSEPVAGQEHPLAWRPSGNLIATTQRFGFDGGGAGREERHDIVFFERNGLRHGEFGLRSAELVVPTSPASETNIHQWGYKVRELSWSCDSTVLSVWIERDMGDIVQLWTTGNYHWYLKQEITASNSSVKSNHFTSVKWHPEAALTLILTTSSDVIQRTYAWEIFSSPTKPPTDSASVAVLDGSRILLTPFRTQNIPPPLSSCQLSLWAAASRSSSSPSSRTPIHVSFSPSKDILAVLWETGAVALWDLGTRLESGRGNVMNPIKVWEGVVGDECRQIKSWPADVLDQDRLTGRLIVLGSAYDGCDMVTLVDLDSDNLTRTRRIQLPKHSGRLVESESIIVWQAPDGELFEVNLDSASVSALTRFPEFCFSSNHIFTSNPNGQVCHSNLYVGLAASGRLYLIGDLPPVRVLESNVTSFTISSGFLIFTTNAHEVIFASLSRLASAVPSADNGDVKGIMSGWERRKVERGSRIVTAVPSTMSLVLQMPRGNLETINPRPLAMEVIKQDLNTGNYRKAFLACRKHRIDLNILVEHDRAAFLANLSSFVEQVHDVDHINLFLTSLGHGSQPPEAISQLCDALRVELETRDVDKYVNSILTAYVVKSPPDYEAGLRVLLRIRDRNLKPVEDAIKYLIFLVDADKLFDIALGMYDFSLVLMVAQHSQKDPREYLPFLRELRTLDQYYQRFKIDEHLGRHESALRNLHLAGSDHFDEATGYLERHRLHKLAMSLWKGTDQYPAVLDIYGNWLFERRLFDKAALVFIEAGRPPKALVAYEKALKWPELFDLAAREKIPEEDIVSMAYRVAENLSSKKRHSESARVLLDYSDDVREAVIALVQGNNFSEARRIATLHEAPELLTDVIHPGVLEACAQLTEDIHEMKEQLRKQLHRLGELRVKRTLEPEAFYGIEDSNLDNVDVMTDVSMPATTFTRYTVAPSVVSRTSKQTSRSKRKMERKMGSGRKGTADEEEYLLKSVTKLVGRFDTLQGEVANVLPHLCQFTPEHRSEGKALQDDLEGFELELRDSLEKIWIKPREESEAVPVNDTWASRMAEKEKGRLVDPSVLVMEPKLATREWRVDLLDMGV